MGCAASKRVENAEKDTSQKDNKGENEGCDRNPPTLICSHRQDVERPVVPVAEDENGNNLNTFAKINDQAILEQSNPVTLTNLDKTTEIGHENDGVSQNLTNMDLNGETVLSSGADKILILHFNDVYNIEPREKEPVGGAARFASKIATFQSRNPLVLFSGDALNPSMMSSITKGEQMLPVLNCLGIKAAVYGNHDFDFGVDELVDFANESNFPWLMSNVFDKHTKRPLAEGRVSLTLEWNGHKIGLIGLVEREWLVTLATVAIDEVDYLDFITEGRRLCSQLRQEGCDFIIALTHMREPNDIKLAENVSEIDLILGGHDHHYEIREVKGTKIFKSGTDFRNFSEIEVVFSSNDDSYEIQSKKHEITKDVPENPEIKVVVDKYLDIVKEKMEGVLGNIEVELDGRFGKIRTQETNLGNLIADITRNVTQADVSLVNSGTLRSDTIHSPGEFKMKDLVSILPMPDAVVVLRITGAQLLIALNNGVSQWPRLEGRFPQVSGVTFAFDPDMDPDQRVIEKSVKVGGKKLELERKYKLCTKGYISHGKDGYDVFKDCEVLVNEEEGSILPTIVRNHFVSCNIVKGLQMCRSGHRQSITCLEPGSLHEELAVIERRHCTISPKVEGRIRVVYQQRTEENGT
ncbi:5 -nucleotidase-like isoform X2 [Paramuricea clavata]|uniref:5 -nucleotidase-like isoform X2 n=1 Tax=Paramuricea clavata TaxID=317549 RepID=A0A6S7FHR5_PARCT|nr:5 -nucleotidase-like isoform X2 [Paramuricea clavata]